MKKNRIFRTVYDEWWDVHNEDAIIFPEDMPLKDVFNKKNLSESFPDYLDDNEYKWTIKLIDDDEVDITIESVYDGEIELFIRYVEMCGVVIINNHKNK